jgi:putative ABC transport system substrate-binding protein
MYRQRALIVAKIFRGANPSDIPVEQPNRYELVVNMKAAQAMGSQIANGLVLRADKLIE